MKSEPKEETSEVPLPQMLTQENGTQQSVPVPEPLQAIERCWYNEHDPYCA